MLGTCGVRGALCVRSCGVAARLAAGVRSGSGGYDAAGEELEELEDELDELDEDEPDDEEPDDDVEPDVDPADCAGAELVVDEDDSEDLEEAGDVDFEAALLSVR